MVRQVTVNHLCVGSNPTPAAIILVGDDMICQNCSNEFPMYVHIDGKRKCLSRRKYCLACSPIGKGGRPDLKLNPEYIGATEEQRRTISGERAKKRSNEKRTKRRRDMAAKMIEYKGGKCQICGYDRCSRALEFHHLDPSKKDFTLARTAWARSWDVVKAELDKCALLCANCHREVEAGLVQI